MKAYELLSKKSKWIRHTMARNKRGSTVDSLDPSACCWCVHGAIMVCYPSRDDRLRIIDRLKALIFRRYGRQIETNEWNDLHATHKEIIAFLKEVER